MKPITVLTFTDTSPEALARHMPPWFPKLYDGCVFGKRKDKLIREILELGGMDFLESRCGMRFLDGGESPNCNPTIRELISIKEELEKKQLEAKRMLQCQGKYSVISESGGATFAVFKPKRKRKGKI